MLDTQDHVATEVRQRALDRLNAAHERNKDRAPRLQPYILSYWSEWGAEVGSGKTLSVAAVAARYHAYGIKVLHNGPLRFGEEWTLDRLMRLDYENCAIVIDEVKRLMNRWRAMSTVQVDVVDALVELRKAGVQVLTTGQAEDEVNKELVKRSRFAIYCQTRDKGQSVIQRVVFRPRTPIENQSVIRKKWMHRFWPLYRSFMRMQIGEYRLSAREVRARREGEINRNIVALVQGAHEQGMTEVTSLMIQLAMREQFKVDIEATKIGRTLGELGLIFQKKRTGHFWGIPPGLFGGPEDFEEVNEEAGG